MNFPVLLIITNRALSQAYINRVPTSAKDKIIARTGFCTGTFP